MVTCIDKYTISSSGVCCDTPVMCMCCYRLSFIVYLSHMLHYIHYQFITPLPPEASLVILSCLSHAMQGNYSHTLCLMCLMTPSIYGITENVSHLRFWNLGPVGNQVELNAICSSRQGHSTDEQYCHQYIGRCGRKIHHLCGREHHKTCEDSCNWQGGTQAEGGSKTPIIPVTFHMKLHIYFSF